MSRAAQLFDLSGTSMLVTGAAGGLGLAMAEVLAVNGAHVTMLDIDAARLAASADALAGRGAAVTAVALDVADTEALAGAIDRAAAHRGGRLDAVFANAGISAGPGFGADAERGALANIDAAGWDRVVAVDLTAVMHTLRLASVRMRRQGGGRIVVTASVAGLRAEPFCGYAYAAAKAGVVQLVRQAAVELAPFGVLVNAIAPGFLHTDIGGGRLHDPEVRERLAAKVPMRRVGDPTEVQGLALYFASRASSYTTGTVVPVDGGVLAGSL